MVEKIHDLAKDELNKRYGISKQPGKSLNVTTNDTLFTLFRKTADFIYRHGEWTKKDELTAVRSMLERRESYWGREPQEVEITKIEPTQEQADYLKATRLFKTDNVKDHMYLTKYSYINGKGEKKVNEFTILLDSDNKVGTKHMYAFNRTIEVEGLPKSFMMGNLNRAIGYDKLFSDVINKFDEQKPTGFTKENVFYFLDRLIQADKRNFKGFIHDTMYDFEITPEMRQEAAQDPDGMASVRWGKTNLKWAERHQARNRTIDWLNKYLKDTYNLTLQVEYENDIDKETHAKSWQTKKNINKSTLEVMNNSNLNIPFESLELDNSVDLNRFKQAEVTFQEMMNFLPKSTNREKPILRLRKLGNHKALGLFVPYNNTIAVDFRSSKSKTEYQPAGTGIQSFIHEYGHFLDYNTSPEVGISSSLQNDFSDILYQVQHKIDNHQKMVGKEFFPDRVANYFKVPTEVFARAFEIYSSEAGLDNSLIFDKSAYQNELQYTFFTDDIKAKITEYFDNKFPGYRERIKEYNALIESKKQQAQNIETDTKTIENVEQQDLDLTNQNVSDEPKNDRSEKLNQELDESREELLNAVKKDLKGDSGNQEITDNSESKLEFSEITKDNLELLAREQTKGTKIELTEIFDDRAFLNFGRNLDILRKINNADIDDKVNFLGTEFTVEEQGTRDFENSVGRPAGVTLSYIDSNGNEQTLTLPGNNESLAANYLVSAIYSNVIEPNINNEKTNNNQTQEENKTPETENYRLRKAREKLQRLEKEFEETSQSLNDHYTQTNGQPMNDKRNGDSFFNEANRLEEKISKLNNEIKEQRERVARLEASVERKAEGLNRSGNGLELSVDNIPRIQEEIERFEKGESSYSKKTIEKYRQELVELERSAKLADSMAPEAKKVVDSGKLSQWKKRPNIYFVKGLRGVAFVINEQGMLEVSSKYTPKTDREREIVNELLELQRQSESGQEISQDNEKTTIDSDQMSDKNNEDINTDTENVTVESNQNNIETPPRKITTEMISKAEGQDILAVAQSLGIELVRGRNAAYHWVDEPSFEINSKTKLFTWKDKDIYNKNVISLVEAKESLNYREAVLYLNDNEIPNFDFDKVKIESINGEIETPKVTEVDINGHSKNEIEPSTSEENTSRNETQENGETKESYALSRSKNKLARLEQELESAQQAVFDHFNSVNGNPSDNRAFFEQSEQLGKKVRSLMEQVEKQKKRVKQQEFINQGFNRQGNGLELSVDNIDRIEQEIKKFDNGESAYSKATINKYRKELENLKQESKLGSIKLSKPAKQMLKEGKLKQWKKHPNVFFIKELKKSAVALEINEDGTFKPSEKYVAKTPEEQEIVKNLLDQLSIKKEEPKQEVQNNVANQETKVNEPIIPREAVRITEKEIAFAREQNILNVAQALGINLTHDTVYHWSDEPTFEINPENNSFTWGSKDLYKEDPISLVQNRENLNYQQAVKYLNVNEFPEYTENSIESAKTVENNVDNEGQDLDIKPSSEESQTQVETTSQLDENGNPLQPGWKPVNRRPGYHKYARKNQINYTNRKVRNRSLERASAIQTAKSRDILEVAEMLGMKLKRQGNTYQWVEHDSLTIFPKTNSFKWFNPEHGDYGDPIALVQAVTRDTPNPLNFNQSIAFLLKNKFTGAKPVIYDAPKKEFSYLLRDENNIDKAVKYLSETRGINPKVVEYFAKKGILAQATRFDKAHNLYEPVIVFKNFDENAKFVGAYLEGIDQHPEIYGTHHGRRKEIVTNSDGNVGTNISIGKPKNVILCESNIDMMSYFELKGNRRQLKDTMLVSMNGLKESTVSKAFQMVMAPKYDGKTAQYMEKVNELANNYENAYEQWLKTGATITLAVDNDKAGLELYKKLSEKYPNIPIKLDVPPKAKGQEKMDWNDYLKALKQSGKPLEQELDNVEFAPEQIALEKRQAEIIGNSQFESQSKEMLQEQEPQEKTKAVNNTDTQEKIVKEEPKQQEIPQNDSSRQENSKQEVTQDNSKVTRNVQSKAEQQEPQNTKRRHGNYNPVIADSSWKNIRNSKENMIQLNDKAQKIIRKYATDPEGFKNYLDYMSLNPGTNYKNAALIQEKLPGTKMALTYKQWQELGIEKGITEADVEGHFVSRNGKTLIKNRKLTVLQKEKSKVKCFRPNTRVVVPRLDDKGELMRNSNGALICRPKEQASSLELEKLATGEMKGMKGYVNFIRDEKGQVTYSNYAVYGIEQTSLKKDRYDKVLNNYKVDLSNPKHIAAMQQSLGEISKLIKVPVLYDNEGILKKDELGKYDQKTQKIYLNSSLSPEQKIKTQIKLLSEADFDSTSRVGHSDDPRIESRRMKHVAKRKKVDNLKSSMAEYMLKERLGIEHDNVTPGVIGNWATRLDDLRATDFDKSLKQIQKETNKFSKIFDRSLSAIKQQQNINLVQNVEPVRAVSM